MSVADWARAYVGGDDVSGRGLADAVLAPAEAAYRAGVALRSRAYETGLLRRRPAPLPVLSVGNLLVGGAGKTPVAAFLAARLAERGASPAVIHGGYAGDEPLLHRSWNPGVPVIVGRDRLHAVRRAAEAGADVAVLDDGFQHLRLARTVDLVLVPVERWCAAPRLLPRGPWRETPKALARADLIGLTHRGADAARVDAVRHAVRHVVRGAPPEKAGPADGAADAPPVAEFVVEAVGWRRLGSGERGGAPRGPALGVCAIANPAGFRRSAARSGATVTTLLTYGDHHAYDASDLERIVRHAAGRPILTTEKDAVKLAALADRAPVWALVERVRVAAGDEVLDRVLASLAS